MGLVGALFAEGPVFADVFGVVTAPGPGTLVVSAFARGLSAGGGVACDGLCGATSATRGAEGAAIDEAGALVRGGPHTPSTRSTTGRPITNESPTDAMNATMRLLGEGPPASRGCGVCEASAIGTPATRVFADRPALVALGRGGSTDVAPTSEGRRSMGIRSTRSRLRGASAESIMSVSIAAPASDGRSTMTLSSPTPGFVPIAGSVAQDSVFGRDLQPFVRRAALAFSSGELQPRILALQMSRTQRDSRAQWMRSNGEPSVVGHRGAMGVRPENTLVAFEHARTLGAEWIELDVHLAKDGVPVVIHDASLERTTNGRGKVHRHSSSALTKLDAGSWLDPAFSSERVPRLTDVLAWAKAHGTKVEIELKGEPLVPEALPAAVLTAVAQHQMGNDVLVISFDHVATRRSKELDKAIKTGVLYVARPVDEVALAKKALADVLIPHATFVTAESVRDAHEAGLAIATWAPSEPAFLRALLATGVDAITVDHPDMLRKLVDRRAPKPRP